MHKDINTSLNVLVYKTNLALKSRLQSALKDFDITSEQWFTLRRLNEKDGYNQKELSIDLFKEQAAVTRTLDILEKKGLVERRKSPNDRREFLVLITDKGKELLIETLPNIKKYRELLNLIIDEEETQMLKAILDKLYSGLISAE